MEFIAMNSQTELIPLIHILDRALTTGEPQSPGASGASSQVTASSARPSGFAHVFTGGCPEPSDDHLVHVSSHTLAQIQHSQKPSLKSHHSLKHSADTRAQVTFYTTGADVAVLIIGAQCLTVLEVFTITIIPQVRAVLLFLLYW